MNSSTSSAPTDATAAVEAHASAGAEEPTPSAETIYFSGTKFMIACVIAAAGITWAGRVWGMPIWLLAAEVFLTIICLFLLGSFRYQLHKNPLTYGAGLVIFATFLGVWWEQHGQLGRLTSEEIHSWGPILQSYLLTFDGLEKLIHIDTILFILGLTFFVSAVAQTRILEVITFYLLRTNRGWILPTVLAVTATVAFASGIFGGVSMIGLTIRTLVIVLLLANTPLADVRYAVMVCTILTTVCGMWMVYGEPPNLIMESNVMLKGKPLLTEGFFLRYCLPAAVVSYLCVAYHLRKRLRGRRVEMENLDILSAQSAVVRFVQAARHGEVLSMVELAEAHAADLGGQAHAIVEQVRRGEPLGRAMVQAGVEPQARLKVLEAITSAEMAPALDRHYVLAHAGDKAGARAAEAEFVAGAGELGRRRVVAQRIAMAAILPFLVLLITHGLHHEFPLYPSALAGFAIAIAGIWTLPKVRRLALHEAKLEFAEYYFLFPLFLSITLLVQVGFFDAMRDLLEKGIHSMGTAGMALLQFAGATFLSALLDNNVVADFASRALHGMPVSTIHLFAMAQIAGYAAGGCWTHIGSAQSVVAFAFIRRDLDARYSPLKWLDEMTPVLVTTVLALAALILIESLMLNWLD